MNSHQRARLGLRRVRVFWRRTNCGIALVLPRHSTLDQSFITEMIFHPSKETPAGQCGLPVVRAGASDGPWNDFWSSPGISHFELGTVNEHRAELAAVQVDEGNALAFVEAPQGRH